MGPIFLYGEAVSLFSQPLPIAPHPRAQHRAVREGQTITALGETRGVLAKLVEFLRPFSVNSVTGIDGKKLDVLSRDGGAGAPAEGVALQHPWHIYVTNFGDGWVAGVDYHSDIYDGITWDKKTVSGLLTDSSNPNDAGWNTAQQGYIYLRGMVADSVVGSINVNLGAATLDIIERIKIPGSPAAQTEFAYVLGYLWSTTVGTATTWYVRQEAFRHLTIMNVLVNSVMCKIPFGI